MTINTVKLRNLISWLAQVYVQYSKLKLLEKDFDFAKSLILYAEEIAVTNNLFKLSHFINAQYIRILSLIANIELLKTEDQENKFDNLITGVGQRDDKWWSRLDRTRKNIRGGIAFYERVAE